MNVSFKNNTTTWSNFCLYLFFAVCIPAFDVISRVHKGFRSPLVQLPIAVSRLMIDVVPHDKNRMLISLCVSSLNSNLLTTNVSTNQWNRLYFNADADSKWTAPNGSTLIQKIIMLEIKYKKEAVVSKCDICLLKCNGNLCCCIAFGQQPKEVTLSH